MFPEMGKLVCKREACGFRRGITEDDSHNSRIVTRAREETLEPLVLEEITETLPRTRIECPKCTYGEAIWHMRQTRAADEPTTRIYRCVRCSHTWREY
jgi:DNA-directed RNA polymerase subunit M